MDDEYWGEPEWPEEGEVVDEYVEQAKPILAEFFDAQKGQLFYLKQLQVSFEKRFFHWVTYRVLMDLAEEGEVGTEIRTSPNGTVVRLFHHRGHRYRERQAGSLLRLIDEMSGQEVAEACGEQADMLFFNALMARRFVSAGQDVREYSGNVWDETGHDLDFIIERDGVGYGCEVKNRWDYIGRGELEVKLRMCGHLGIRPLFVMRASPKTYNNMIIEAGGYAMIFVAHIYPFGMNGLVRKIREELGLEADSPRAIPGGIIDRFEKWHRKSL